MKKITILFAFLSVWVSGHGGTADSLLRVLDTTIAEKASYSAIREAAIDSLKVRYRRASSLDEKSALANRITLEYIVCRTDSALWYVTRMEEHAARAGNVSHLAEAQINRARTLRVMGLYKEAWDLLDSVEYNFPGRMTVDYLDTRLSVANAMKDYATEEDIKSNYQQLAGLYRDSLLRLSRLPEIPRLFVTAEDRLSRKDWDGALGLLHEKYALLDPDSRNAGIVAYSIAAAYRGKGDAELETEYFARSAIGDLRAGVKDYTSLRRLAELMYAGGDIDRAYAYTKCSLEDALSCNARLGAIEASDMFIMIDRAYQQKERQRRSMLYTFFTLAGVLLVIMSVMTLVIFIQNRRVRRTRDQLAATNGALDSSNRELLDADRIKEEYIGLYMEQYSDHLSSLTSLKNKTHKYARGNGDVKGLMSVVDGAIDVEEELKNFYVNFDATVLHLFPDFPEKFDELLVPEARGIYSKIVEGGLTPELRIFALMRLGIRDSMKISHFLRYSASTIYNYRTKLRNKAIGERDEFENNVAKLCRPNPANR